MRGLPPPQASFTEAKRGAAARCACELLLGFVIVVGVICSAAMGAFPKNLKEGTPAASKLYLYTALLEMVTMKSVPVVVSS